MKKKQEKLIDEYHLAMWNTEFIFSAVCQESSSILNILSEIHSMEKNNTNIKELTDKTEGVMTNNLAVSII